MQEEKMKKTIFLLVSLVLLAGCATTALVQVDGVDASKAESLFVIDRPGLAKNRDIIEINNDFYYRETECGFWGTNATKFRRLTNTPNIKKEDIRYHKKGAYITYFADYGNGRHWYMQPLLGDDSNRQKVSAKDMIRLED